MVSLLFVQYVNTFAAFIQYSSNNDKNQIN